MSDHYTYRVSWSADDQEFVGTCSEFPSLSHLDSSDAEALAGIKALVADVVADMKANGEEVPKPFAEQRFSGNFQTRVTADLHRRLVIEAADAGVSLNRLVGAKLALPLDCSRPVASPARHHRARQVA